MVIRVTIDNFYALANKYIKETNPVFMIFYLIVSEQQDIFSSIVPGYVLKSGIVMIHRYYEQDREYNIYSTIYDFVKNSEDKIYVSI